MRTTPSISAQLHSVSAQAAKDLDGTLERIAALGYAAVEPIRQTGTPAAVRENMRRFISEVTGTDPGALLHSEDVPAPALKRALDRHGLVVSACHVYLPEGDAAEAILDEQELLGNRLLVANAGIENLDDPDSIRQLAERYNAAAERARPRGMRIGYHNHFTEVRAASGGRSGLELFFDLLEPDLFAEVDIYWSHIGGRQPADLIQALGDRVLLLHVKDGNGTFGDVATGPGKPTTAVGLGSLDIPAVLRAAAHVRWLTVELEMMGDVAFRALDESRRYLLGQATPQAAG